MKKLFNILNPKLKRKINSNTQFTPRHSTKKTIELKYKYLCTINTCHNEILIH